MIDFAMRISTTQFASQFRLEKIVNQSQNDIK